KDNKLTFNIAGIQTSMTKVSLAMFITEVFYLSVKEDNPNEELFFFLENSVIYINDCENERELRDFHIYFLYHLSCILGFEPMNNYSSQMPFFDISKGTFVAYQEEQTLDKELSLLFYKTLLIVKNDYVAFTENPLKRNALLNIFICFFEQHITNNRHIKSHQILHSIF
ncbi:MAG: DNA repair protein RecO C-terminal domain-containing protein, partial [Bacteroidales bacterium]|nr:DNA repair protein RecO C-terminal domain-containing protein [Bacteroidales bacterium]